MGRMAKRDHFVDWEGIPRSECSALPDGEANSSAGQCYEGLDSYQMQDTYERLLNAVADPTVRKEARTALERVRRKLPDEVDPKITALSRTAVLELLASQQYIPALSMA